MNDVRLHQAEFSLATQRLTGAERLVARAHAAVDRAVLAGSRRDRGLAAQPRGQKYPARRIERLHRVCIDSAGQSLALMVRIRGTRTAYVLGVGTFLGFSMYAVATTSGQVTTLVAVVRLRCTATATRAAGDDARPPT